MPPSFLAFLAVEPAAASKATAMIGAMRTITGTSVYRNQGQAGSTLQLVTAREPVLAVRGSDLMVEVFGTLHCSDMLTLECQMRCAGTAVEAAHLLIAGTWGAYVACFEDRYGKFVMRDPSGAIPLHVARFPGLQIAASHLTPRLLAAAGLHCRINLPAVATLLANPPAAAHLSGLVEVEIAVPGRLVSLTVRGEDRTIWSPGDIARRRAPLAPEELASSIDHVIGTLAGADLIGVELSGGFDSSVVFSTLAGLGVQPKPFNFATAGKGGDETRFARDVAGRWGIPLRTHASGSKLPDYRIFDTADHGVQPTLHGLDSVFAEARQSLIDEERVGKIMTGQGGDALFFRLPTRLIALDRRREQGVRSLFAHSTVDDARRVRGSIWSVLSTAFGRRTGDDRPEIEWQMSHLLGPYATSLLKGAHPKHPWLDRCDDLPPAKKFHLMMLSHCQLFHGDRLLPATIPVIHPLLSQPLIDLVLACPTYILQSGPLDRGLARAAVKDRLPASVLHRRNKGEASDHYARAILKNRDWLRSHLLDGKLAEIGLLDRTAVERAMEPDAMRMGTDYRAFVQYASVESWLRYWSF